MRMTWSANNARCHDTSICSHACVLIVLQIGTILLRIYYFKWLCQCLWQLANSVKLTPFTPAALNTKYSATISVAPRSWASWPFLATSRPTVAVTWCMYTHTHTMYWVAYLGQYKILTRPNTRHYLRDASSTSSMLGQLWRDDWWRQTTPFIFFAHGIREYWKYNLSRKVKLL